MNRLGTKTNTNADISFDQYWFMHITLSYLNSDSKINSSIQEWKGKRNSNGWKW